MTQIIILIGNLIKIIPFYLSFLVLRVYFSPNGVFEWVLFIIAYLILVPIIYYLLMMLFGLCVKVFNLKVKP